MRCATLQASASDADSSLARARSDPMSLVCAGEAVSPECSDEDEAPPPPLASGGPQQQQQQQQEAACSGSPLQPLQGAAAALVPTLGAVCDTEQCVVCTGSCVKRIMLIRFD